MPDELPSAQPPGPPRRRLPSAKDTLMRMNQSKDVQRQADREARRKEAEKRRKVQYREIMRLATNDIEKVVARDAADKDYDDAWTYLEEVAQHGCSSGIVGDLIYYTDTAKFYQKHKAAIWEQLGEDADSHGTSIMEMLGEIPSFRDNVTDESTFENYMAWYAYEAACQRLLDKHENPDVYGGEEGPTPNLDIDV